MVEFGTKEKINFEYIISLSKHKRMELLTYVNWSTFISSMAITLTQSGERSHMASQDPMLPEFREGVSTFHTFRKH